MKRKMILNQKKLKKKKKILYKLNKIIMLAKIILAKICKLFQKIKNSKIKKKMKIMKSF